MPRKKRSAKKSPAPVVAPSAPAPEASKSSGFWGVVLTTTPIALTLVATAFAGLSSSEMMRSMYYRSLAAQHQAKAADQWAFFQAKRIRGTTLESTNDLFAGLTAPSRFTAEFAETVFDRLLTALRKTATPESLAIAARVEPLRSHFVQRLSSNNAIVWASPTPAKLPRLSVPKLPNDVAQKNLAALLDAIAHRQTEAETAALVGLIPMTDIEEATRLAETTADRFDAQVQPLRDDIDQTRAEVKKLGDLVAPLRPWPGNPADEAIALVDHLARSFKSTSLDFDVRRYQAESAFNRTLAELYEARVRRSGIDSDRHRGRSAWFFYSMLLAQVGVTIASLALAREQRHYLWAVAVVSGFAALSFGGFVFTAY